MRALVLAAALAAPLAALGTVPALAQTGGQAGASMPAPGQGAADGTAMRTKLQEDLGRAGFTNISVMPEAFAVHATNSAGQRVFMLISPDSVTEVVPTPNAMPARPAPGTTKG